MINYIMDILYILIAAITIAVFAKRGFVQSVFKYGKTVMAIAFAYVWGPSVGKWLFDKYIYNSVYNRVSLKVNSVVQSVVGAVDVDNVFEELPKAVKHFVSRESVEAEFGKTLENINEATENFTSFVSTPFSTLVSNLVAYVLVFCLSLLCLFFLAKLFDLATKFPILNGINKFLGFLLGAFSAFLLLAVITFVIGLFAKVFVRSNMMNALLENACLFKFFNKIELFKMF